MSYYKLLYIQELERLIQEEFPEIKGLKLIPKGNKFEITFESGGDNEKISKFIESTNNNQAHKGLLIDEISDIQEKINDNLFNISKAVKS